MKKIIFLLLLAQTISFITADSGCMKHTWGWGEKMPEHTNCSCNCERYTQVLTNRRKCIECGHFRVPKEIKIISTQLKSVTLPENNTIVENHAVQV